jgi:aromatic ring-opening dioxygenase LigB subunit
MIVFAAIAPHGDPAFLEGSPTHEAMCELGRRHRVAGPETTVVLTPHNVHVDGAFAVITAGSVSGRLDEHDVGVTRAVDLALARVILDGLHETGLSAVGVSYGSNDPTLGEMPLDWGALIPLYFLSGEEPVVVVAPCRDLRLEEHVRAGEAIATVCEGRRVTLVASADHAHRHDENGPFGFHEAAAAYDERVVEFVREDRLGELGMLEPLVEDAYADSLWQLAMLSGAL